MTEIAFWYDFASTYSYLSAMRIEALAAEAGVEVGYMPFLLGPIFKQQGLNTSPFVANPAKGGYMVRDIERIAEARGIPFRMPASFPANSLTAARIAIVGEGEGWVGPFTRAVFEAEFARSEDIASRDVLSRILAELGQDPARVLAAAETPETKNWLRHRTEWAAKTGIFGAPSFVTSPDGEFFWGDDRLEQAIAWAKNAARNPSA